MSLSIDIHTGLYPESLFLDFCDGYDNNSVFSCTDTFSTLFSTGLGNIRLKYTAHPQTGEPQPLEETKERGSRTPLKNKQRREQNHYYPLAYPLRSIRGLTHDGYQPHHDIIGLEGANVTIIPTSPNVGDPYKYKYNQKEWQNDFNLNVYDYGARNYMPDLGRYFNMDKFSEAYVDLNPYQYTANNPVKFIDVNGDYIYIWDNNTRYRYENGEAQKQNEDGKWETHQAEDGSYLAQVLGFLGDITGGDENSFGSRFLNLFENEDIDVFISQNKFEDRNKGKNITVGNVIYTDFNQKGSIRTTGRTESISQNYHTTLFHELGHGFANNVISASVLNAVWIKDVQTINGTQDVSKSEVFASMVENMLRAEQGLNLRTHYIGGTSDNRSRLIIKSKTQSPFNKTYEPTETTRAIWNELLNSRKQ